MRALLVDALVVVLTAVAPVVIERLRGLEHAGSDLAMMFIPDYAWWWSRPRWTGGWNPWIFGGFPGNADPLVGHVHPLGLLWAALPPLTASAVEGALAPALAGVGMLLYLRRIGCGRTGSVVGAIAFASGGYVHAHAVHPEKLRSVLAIPWALLAVEALDGRRLVAGLGAAVAVVVAGGHPQTIAFSLVLVALYAAVFARGRRAWAVAGLAVGAAIPAVTWLPAVELVLRSEHVHTVIAGVDHLGAACAPALVVPFACGGGSGAFYGSSVERFPGCGIVDCTGYPGMAVWLVLLAGCSRLPRTTRGRFWIAIGVAGLVLSTDVVERLLPIPGVRAPSRALLWWNLASAAGAALILGTGAAELRRPRPWAAAAVVLLAVVVLAGTRSAAAERASLGSLAVLAVTVAAIRRGGHWPAVAVLAADLVVFGAELHAGVSPRAIADVAAELRRAQAVLRSDDGPAPASGRVVVIPVLFGAMWAQIERVPLVQGWNVLVPATLSRLLNGDGPAPLGYDLGLVQDPGLLGSDSHVLDLLRARVVAVTHAVAEDATWAARLADPRWRPAGASERLRYYVNARARPVAWLVHRVRVVPDAEALRIVRGDGGAFDPAAEALARAPLAVTAASTPERVELAAADDDVLALHVSAGGAGLLVTSELAYPGWAVDVDGRRQPVRTVNAGFRAVEVPGGEHLVVFRYRPALGRAGLVLGGAGLAVLLAAVLPWPRRRGAPSARG